MNLYTLFSILYPCIINGYLC